VTEPPRPDLLHSHGILQFFAYEHFPPETHEVGRMFGELAQWIEASIPSNMQKWSALEKLLESKDCAVRALLFRRE